MTKIRNECLMMGGNPIKEVENLDSTKSKLSKQTLKELEKI